MRKYLLFLIFLFGCFEVSAQQFFLESGKTISHFNFENSNGETLSNLQPSSQTYISIGYRKSLLSERFFWHASANFHEYGSKGSDLSLDNYFEWNISYLGLGLGLDYELFKLGDFTIYPKTSFGTEILIQGTQTLNHQVFNLTKEKDFNSAIFVVRAGLGVQYKISPVVTVFSQYMYGTGGRYKNTQGKLKIKSHNLGLGLLINISKHRKDSIQGNNAQIEELRKALEANSVKIEELKKDAQKVTKLKTYVEEKELEIAKKEQQIKHIKTSISDALIPYKGEGLTVDERSGKVYIVMGNHLIFEPGSTNISAKGKEAIKNLGNILAQNKDMDILIEGHTDNVPFENSNMTNWDLSVKRATSILKMLLQTNKNIDPANLEAAGRGEFDPVADNSTAEGRASNRRIEIILSPKLEELKKLIKE